MIPSGEAKRCIENSVIATTPAGNAKANVEHAKIDTDLDALRQRDDFKALLAELEKNAK